MTPAERARQIDKEEFKAASNAALQKALAYSAHVKKLERMKARAWIGLPEPETAQISKQPIRRQPNLITYDGKQRTLQEWAEHLGVSPSALLQRRRKLGSFEAAISIGGPLARGKSGELIGYNGQTHTINEWAAIIGIKPDTLRKRIFTGMTPQKAIACGRQRGRARPGVVTDFSHSQGTGAGSTAQESAEISFLKKASDT